MDIDKPRTSEKQSHRIKANDISCYVFFILFIRSASIS